MKSIFYLILALASIFSYGQENDDFSKRLKAINFQSVIYYNVDGVDFSSQIFNTEFSEKALKKLYKIYSIKESDIKTKDEILQNNNLVITKFENVVENIYHISSYYFVENKNKSVSVFWFDYYGKQNKEFERKYVNLILNNEIPIEVFEPMTIESINFAGRKLELGNSCYWTNINTVQCPYYGEMNWSVHKTLESAKNSIDTQYYITKNKKGGKVLSEEEVEVIFEGTETKAKKVIYDFTGVKSLLSGMSGGKTLTIYYVACKVRENYVSCCMSFWNNDTITESGLAPLLDKVMKLK